MRHFLVSIVCLLSISDLFAQAEPLLLNKETIAGIDLERRKPSWAPPDRELYSTRIFSGEDIGVNVTASSPGTQSWEDLPVDEFVIVLSGKSVLTEAGASKEFLKGDFFMVPRGFTGSWTTVGGPNYFLEIAVFSKRRAEAATSQTSVHHIPTKKLSGIGSNLNEETMIQGAELTASINRFSSPTKVIDDLATDQFVYVINGMVTISSAAGKETKFYTHDAYVLPKGFSGTLQFEGIGSYQELVVTSVLNDD